MSRRLLVSTIAPSLLLGLCFVACDDEETTAGPTGGSTATTTTTTTTSTTTSTATGGAGTGTECENDAHEPNDQPADATVLPDLTDENVEPTPEVSGVVTGGADTDWYVYDGEDVVGLTVVDPQRRFESPATVLRLCAYFWCSAQEAWGSPAIGAAGGAGAGGSGSGGAPPVHRCPDGTEEVTEDLSGFSYDSQSLGVAAGCCTTPGTNGFHLGGYFPSEYWPLDCPGVLDPDSMLVFLRVETYPNQPDDICTPYTVLYHF